MMNKNISNDNGILPWSGEFEAIDITDVEKALFKIFSTPEGKIMWAYLRRSVIETTISNPNMELLAMQNGKKILVMQLKQLANRAIK